MKKNYFFIALFLINFSISFAQTFETELENSAKLMAIKLNGMNNLNVAVYPFYSEGKTESDLSVLTSDEFSNFLAKYRSKFKIIDRSYMEQMLQEHKLNSEGLIDPTTAKKFGMIIAADVYITGKIYIISNTVRVHLIAINTETGERVYSDFAKFPLDVTISTLAGIKNLKEVEEEASLYKSNNPNCNEKKVGDYCFINNTESTIYVKIFDVGNAVYAVIRDITIEKSEKGCFKDLPTKFSYAYEIYTKNPYSGGFPKSSGNFYIATCKSDFKIIK